MGFAGRILHVSAIPHSWYSYDMIALEIRSYLNKPRKKSAHLPSSNGKPIITTRFYQPPHHLSLRDSASANRTFSWSTYWSQKLELESTYHTSNKEQAPLGLSLLFARWCQYNVLEFVWMILFPPFLFF